MKPSSFPKPESALCLKSYYLKLITKMGMLPYQKTYESVPFIIVFSGFCCCRLELEPVLLLLFLFLSLR